MPQESRTRCPHQQAVRPGGGGGAAPEEVARDAGRGARRHRRRRQPGGAQDGAARARRGPVAARARQPRDRRAAAAGQGRGGQAGRRPAARSARRWPPARPSWRPSATRGLVEEAVDVTLPWDRVGRGRPAPADHARRAHRRRLRRDGLRGRRGPRGRGRVVQLRRPQLPARTTRPGDAGHVLRGRPGRDGDSGVVLRTHTSPVQIRAMLDRGRCRSTWSARAGLPHRRARRHPHPGVPPGRGPRRGRGPDHGRPAGHPRTRSWK